MLLTRQQFFDIINDKLSNKLLFWIEWERKCGFDPQNNGKGGSYENKKGIYSN